MPAAVARCSECLVQAVVGEQAGPGHPASSGWSASRAGAGRAGSGRGLGGGAPNGTVRPLPPLPRRTTATFVDQVDVVHGEPRRTPRHADRSRRSGDDRLVPAVSQRGQAGGLLGRRRPQALISARSWSSVSTGTTGSSTFGGRHPHERVVGDLTLVGEPAGEVPHGHHPGLRGSGRAAGLEQLGGPRLEGGPVQRVGPARGTRPGTGARRPGRSSWCPRSCARPAGGASTRAPGRPAPRSPRLRAYSISLE